MEASVPDLKSSDINDIIQWRLNGEQSIGDLSVERLSDYIRGYHYLNLDKDKLVGEYLRKNGDNDVIFDPVIKSAIKKKIAK